MFDIYSLEQWSVASTVWMGFGTLALIPLFQLIRKHRSERQKEHQSVKERLDDLCERLGLIEKHTEKHSEKIEELDNKFNSVNTNVRILEAIANKNQDEEKSRGRRRKEDDYSGFG